MFLVANNLTNKDLRQITDIVPNCQFHHENFSWCPPPIKKIHTLGNFIYNHVCLLFFHSMYVIMKNKVMKRWTFRHNILGFSSMHYTFKLSNAEIAFAISRMQLFNQFIEVKKLRKAEISFESAYVTRF